MIIALFAEKDSATLVSEKFGSRGHACIIAEDSIPGEADCLVVIGEIDGRESLFEAAEDAGLPVLRISAECAVQAADAIAWGLGLADERYIEAARSDAKVKRLEDMRVKMAEQRALELSVANEVLERQARDLREALLRLDNINRQLIEELNLASELQKSLLPRSYPNDVPLEFAHKFIPLHSVGGDFFDVLRLDERTICLVIADVSGHGVGPALVTALFKSYFSLEARRNDSTSALMAALNNELSGTLTTDHYVTAFAARIDLESLEMRYCSAGHPNQLLIRADGEREELSTMGFLLGMIQGVDYEEKTIQLAGGDTVVLYTDGVFESLNSSGSAFGREGIVRSITSRRDQGPSALSDALISDLLEWTQGTEATDDITLLMAQVIESL